jgi:hypothetical protein
MKPVSEKAVSEMKTPANGRGRFVSLYFECSEVDGAKWQIFRRNLPVLVQIETLLRQLTTI